MKPGVRHRRCLRELEAAAPGEHVPLLVKYLATEDPVRNELAEELFTSVGAPVVPELVREAVLGGKRPGHRIRLLDVVARIGARLDVGDWLALSSAAAVYRGPAGQKMCEVLLRLGHATNDAARPAPPDGPSPSNAPAS